VRGGGRRGEARGGAMAVGGGRRRGRRPVGGELACGDAVNAATVKETRETQTRRELTWGEAIRGQTDQRTSQRTNEQKDRQMKSFIEALASA
jgi:hypothetical protein